MSDIPADILIYALVAAGLIFWLRSVLGTRHGDERERPNPFVTSADPAGDDLRALPAPLDGRPDPAMALDMYDPYADEALIANQAVSETLRAIGRADRNFDPANFKRGAEDAFIMIVEAFSEGDRDFLRPLLAPAVYEGFDKEIARREEKGERVITEIQAVRQARLVDAKITGKDAFISVEFHAEETCVIQDRNGDRIAGNPNRATSMVDIWTFGRNLKAKDPIWLVYETRDGAPEDFKTPLPEAGQV